MDLWNSKIKEKIKYHHKDFDWEREDEIIDIFNLHHPWDIDYDLDELFFFAESNE